MRVNVYAEELVGPDSVELVHKEIGGHRYTAVRFYLQLPASFIPTATRPRPATVNDTEQSRQYQAPFIHHPGDDDSSAVTFWGKQDIRPMLQRAIDLLDEHFSRRSDVERVFSKLKELDSE